MEANSELQRRIYFLEQWKREATLLLDPLLDWGHAQKDIPLGSSVTIEILRRAKAYTEAEEIMGRMAEALIKIIEMNRQHAEDQYGDPEKAETWGCVMVAREPLTEYNNYKQTKDGTVNG